MYAHHVYIDVFGVAVTVASIETLRLRQPPYGCVTTLLCDAREGLACGSCGGLARGVAVTVTSAVVVASCNRCAAIACVTLLQTVIEAQNDRYHFGQYRPCGAQGGGGGYRTSN